MPYIAVHHPDKCRRCEACFEIVNCPGSEESICIGCGACVLMCPNQALELVEERREKDVIIEVDGKPFQVPERISVKEALAEISYPTTIFPEGAGFFAPCEVGGCWCCVLEIDGEVKPACRTIVKEGMKIKTELPKDYVPKRVVPHFSGHPIGGVGTPWESRQEGSFYNGLFYIEAVCFTAGCNFRCPQCQNWPITYRGRGEVLTPRETAQRLTELRKAIKVNRMTISGGECTLNRAWLVQLIKELKKLNPEPQAHFHVDTNGSLLTHDYIDELAVAGVTDIGIDLKALETGTFMQITGLKDKNTAERYKETAWEAVKYLIRNYSDKVFTGVGIPYNKELTSLTELARMGEELLRIDPLLQVTLLNYRPEFRSKLSPPKDEEMETIHRMLRESGLKRVIAQTAKGYIGPHNFIDKG